MTGMTISFTAYIGMTGVITSSTDAAAVKTVRTVISTVLPVVGGMISDASGSVLAAAGVIRSCAGAFGAHHRLHPVRRTVCGAVRKDAYFKGCRRCDRLNAEPAPVRAVLRSGQRYGAAAWTARLLRDNAFYIDDGGNEGGDGMIQESIRQLCAVSIFCGAAINITPEAVCAASCSCCARRR